MGKTTQKLVKDLLGVIYRSTLRVASGHTYDDLELQNQRQMARNLVARLGVPTMLETIAVAYLAMAKSEYKNAGGRTGRVTITVGDEEFVLRPYFRGVDSFMYENWQPSMDVIKREIVNEMVREEGVDVKWGIDFLNFPYDPDRRYLLD